jgi:amino acid adenylation domain-containing protein
MTRLLQQLVSDRALSRPESVAVVCAGTAVRYGELEAASNRLARALRELGCRRGDRIALVMPKIPAAIVSILGALKVDACYVPLDPAGPATRLARMLEASNCRCLVAAGRSGPMVREALTHASLRQRPQLGWMDTDAPWDADPAPAFCARDLASLPAEPLAAANSDRDLAHILFTSGSTGTPKGVMITHYSVRRFLEWAWSYFGFSPSDRISQHPPLNFDLSTFDIFGTLGAGAQLHLVPGEMNLLPHKLAQFMRESQLTQWFSVPSVLTLMAKLDVVSVGDFPELRRVLWCGETIATPTLIHWMRRLPHARFTNLYGPTEATIASSYYTVPRCPSDERQAVPIGTACDGEELLVLDEELRPVADGQTGELYIGGVGLSPGYWNDPLKTRNAFLPCPGGGQTAERIYRTGDLARRGADGLLYFLGRMDSQIKARGYRIELGEIESALNALRSVREGAVVAVESAGFEGWTICCAYVPAPGAGAHPAELRSSLAHMLPGYMLPARWVSCSALPRNANGKLDRPALRRKFLRAAARPPVGEPHYSPGLARG